VPIDFSLRTRPIRSAENFTESFKNVPKLLSFPKQLNDNDAVARELNYQQETLKHHKLFGPSVLSC
jgi:hypothetical protein